MTGTPQVWYVSPFDSHAKMAESFEEGGEELAAELSRLAQGDAEHLSAVSSLFTRWRART